MTGPAAAIDPPPARRRHSHWPGLVWAVPLAALIVVTYLAVQAIAQRGVLVTVTFDRAAGARAGETKVLYQGVEAGELVKILPNKDGRRLDFRLRLLPEAKPGLNTNARFWLIGATPSLSDLSSLKAVVEGVAIGYAPGEGGRPTRSFEGLERAPTVLPGDKGTRYRLEATQLGTIQIGSALLFHGLAIGKVSDVSFDGETGFRLDVFVFQPYDSLIRPGDCFWRSSPVRLSFNGGDIDASLAPASTILTGAIDVEVPTAASRQPQSAADSRFTLFASRDAALQDLSGPAYPYDFAFEDAAGGLAQGASVTLLGFQIGEVQSTHLAYEPHSGAPYTAVTALLYANRLAAVDAAAAAPGDPAAVPAAAPTPPGAPPDARVRALVRLGYRAQLNREPPLVGAFSIALVRTRAAGRADLAYGGPHPRIPSAPGSGGLDGITSQADQILAKLNRVPIDSIGGDVKQVTGRLRALSGSPQLAAGLEHAQSALAEFDRTLTGVQPQLVPLLKKLDQAAGEVSGTAAAARAVLDGRGGIQNENLQDALGQVTAAARSVHTLTDYLERHPEGLLRGKRPQR